MLDAYALVMALGGRWHGSYGVARCPAHEDRSPSLSIRDGTDGRSLVRCHAGCSQQAVIAALRKRGLWGAAASAGERRRFPAAIPAATPADDTRAFVASLWRCSWSAAGSLVETYLRHRGIDLPPPPSIRFHPSLKHTPTGRRLPAMLAAVQGPDGKPIGLHRTFLRPDGGGKARIEPAKMMLGACAGGAVRLAPAADELQIAEGIESALAALQATQRPTWAALSTSGLRSLTLPATVRRVVICADGDDAGEAAAQAAARRWISEGRSVRIARPPRGLDFNDVLQGRAPAEIGDAA